MTYTDPTTGQFVGEHTTPDADNPGEVRRETEWFDSEDDAKRFERIGARPSAARALYNERMRITDVVRERASFPDFMPNDLGYNPTDGFTIDGEPWEQWLKAMTMD